MSTLTLISHISAYDDDVSGNTSLNVVGPWKRQIQNIPVEDPQSKKVTIAGAGSETIFDGTRSTSIDGTTEFSLTASDSDPSRYRIECTGGTAPAFRPARTLDLSGLDVTLTVGLNLSVVVTVDAGTPFGDVEVGDVVFIPGTATGDAASPFNSLNVGYWTVLGASSASITIARNSGTTFEGLTETVTVVSADQFQAFDTSGVQVGDTAVLSSGFATPALRSYSISAVNPSWVEITHTLPLSDETGVVPTASGMLFYTNAKRFTYIEATQECVCRFNGDTSNVTSISPWVAGDKDKVGMMLRTGTVWKLELVNQSSSELKALVITAE
jgi:hypothetical protein